MFKKIEELKLNHPNKLEEIEEKIDSLKKENENLAAGMVGAGGAGAGIAIIISSNNDKIKKLKLYKKLIKTHEEIKKKTKAIDDAFIENIDRGVLNLIGNIKGEYIYWEKSQEKDYETVNEKINYLGMLYEIMYKYFEKEEGKWKLKNDSKKRYKNIIEYLEEPKYIIKVGDKKSKIVKCYGVLEKLSKKYPRKYKDVLENFVNEQFKQNTDLLNNQLLEYKDDKWVTNSKLEDK